MKSFIIILLLCVFGGSKLFAQKTEFIASAPSVVEVGEQFRLSFVLNAKGENLQVPTIKGFDLLAGPSLSTSSNITIINGDMKQNQEYTYTYILEGQEEGEFSIEPAKSPRMEPIVGAPSRRTASRYWSMGWPER